MTVEDLHTGMMDSFDRSQEITRVVRKNGRVKKLRKPRFEVNWSTEGKAKFIQDWFIHHACIRQYYPGEPLIFAAFQGNQVAAFAAWKMFWGKENEYAVLLRLYVSREYRRMGLGRELFMLCAEAARSKGAQKLFISAASPVETQDFYRRLSCTVAKKRIFGPKKDIPLEYSLKEG